MGYQPASSGPSITDPDVAYIRSDGSGDGTGSPSAPFSTFQQAIDAGFTVFDFGVGDFGTVAFSDGVPVTLTFRGRGLGSTVGAITSTAGGSVTLIDLGVHTVSFASINTTPIIEGQPAGAINLSNVKIGVVTAVGSVSSNMGTAGGNGGNITIDGCCLIQEVHADGGANTDDGNGGAGGIVFIDGPTKVTDSLTLAGGASGTSPGSDGALNLYRAAFIPTPTPDAVAVICGASVANVFYANSYP